MSRLFTLNLDFVLMLQCGLMFLLATSIRGLARNESRRSWPWLGWFCLAKSLQALVELVAFDAGTNPWSQVIRAILLSGSSMCLFEFARASAVRGPGRWLHLPIAGGLALAVLLGGEEVGGAYSRFAVALVAAWWAALRLWSHARESRVQLDRLLLRQAALVLVGFQLVGSLPSRLINEEFFLNAVGLPLSVVRGLFALVLAFAIFGYQVSRSESGFSSAQREAKRRRRMTCGGTILLLVLAGWFTANYSGNRQDAAMRGQILARTQLAAATVNPDDVRSLNWDERDLTNPSYHRLKALMMAERHANADLRFALIAGLRDGKSYFLVDSEPADSPDYSPPGQSYDEAPVEYLAGMISKKSFINGPFTDRWGTWVTGSVPIRDANGRCLADMELDIAAADWDALVRTARLPMLLITLLIAAIVIGSFRALEELREGAEQIVLSEQRNRSLVEGSPDCVQMFDLAGRYLAVNQNGLRVLGLTEAAVLGRHFADLWPIETRPRILEAVRTTVAGQPTSFEADYMRPDGQIVTWRVATNPVCDASGRVASFVGICVDLTVRKHAEIAMLAAQRAAESAAQAKSEFLAVMSHEIRTPLAGVIGMLELLQQSPLDPKPRRYTEFARDSADSLLHLFDDVLDTAKFEAGRVTLEAIPFRPHQYFEALFGSAVMRAESKGLTLRHSIAPSVPSLLIGDPSRLRQVINNLVNNALKFTERGGVTVTLSTEPVTADSVRLKIAVGDTGIGIPEETRIRLFGKFVQADVTTSRRFGGTGLGLSIVKSLAELMGGEVDVTSTEGVGSTFTFSACFAVAPDSELLAVAQIPVAGSAELTGVGSATNLSPSLRVLVVDDDEANRTVAETLLASHGHQVSTAVNGREAVNRLYQEAFDLVLMDCRMPKMDGFTATREIRAFVEGATSAEVYILALTANNSPEDRVKCLAAGMNDFATKPVRAAAIGLTVERVRARLRDRGQVTPLLGGLPVATGAEGGLPVGLSEAELLASLAADEAAVGHADAEPQLPEETLQRITEIFLRETPKRMVTLRASLLRRDADAFGIEAHALKGNARYFNARRLGELAATMETLANQNQMDRLAPLLAETEQAFADLQTQLLHPTTH